jgi:hypothetical protein
MKIGILASAVGLAVSAAAIAEATKATDLIPISKTSFVDPEIQIYQQTGFPRMTDSIVGDRRLSPATGGREFRMPAKADGANTFSPRGGINVVSVGSDYSNAPVNTSLGGAGVNFVATSQSGDLPEGIAWNLRGQGSVAFVRVIDPTLPIDPKDPMSPPATPAPPAGSNMVANQTNMVRHRVGTAQPANGFFTGHNNRVLANIANAPQDLTTFPVAPTADNPASISMEIYNTTLGTLDTFEPVAVFTGFITGRVMWGGTCSEDAPGDCTDIGLPIGALTEYVSLGPDPASFTTGLFVPSSICTTATGDPIVGCVPPAGSSVGDPAAVVLNNWHRMIGETTSDGRFITSIDRLDGTPAYSIYSNVILTSGFLDRVGSNASFELQDAETFFDNVVMTGEPFLLPTAPVLECPYVDDIEWINTGPVLGQTARYFAALSSALTVINDPTPGRGQVLQQINNISANDQFREEFNSALPAGFATAGDPWSLCADIRTTMATVRSFAPDSELTNFVAGGVTTRVFLGQYSADGISFDNSIFVQINVEYDPNDPNGTPPGDNNPVIGVDIVDTGANWMGGVYNTLCLTVGFDNSLDVSVNGNSIYTGSAFSNGATIVRFESENNAFGTGASMRVDNIDFACSALPIVTLPALTVPYLDDIEWGLPGLSPARHIDDPANSPLASTRYTNANGVVIADDSFRGGASTVVAMQNVFTDTLQVAPPDINAADAFIFTQFTTDTPSITVDASTTWTVEMEWAMSDFLTSRGFSPAQLADVGGAFELAGYLWYAAGDDTFYLFAAADGATSEDDLININTGVTRASLGILENTFFTVAATYNLDNNKIDWSVNGTVIGSSNPIIGTDDLGNDRIHRNLDAIFVWGGDDDTAPPVAPFSTMYLDNIAVTTGAVVCEGDSNGDGLVNFTDLNAVLSTFGQTGAGIPGDVNGDGVVNFSDLNLVLTNFGTDCNNPA